MLMQLQRSLTEEQEEKRKNNEIDVYVLLKQVELWYYGLRK